MKAYFAKWLPVEGEIKGAMCLAADTKLTFLMTETDYVAATLANSLHLYKKIELFLCSRDIKVGDDFQDVFGKKFKCTEIYEDTTMDNKPITMIGGDTEATDSANVLKIIGRISPEATWVKEGDEFDERETSYSQEKVNLIERLRLDWEKRTGLGLRSWVKDSEDGYKSRYQGTIYKYSEHNGSLQIFYGSTGTWGGYSWGYEGNVIPMNPEEIESRKGSEALYEKGQNIIKIKGPCGHFH